MVVTEAAPPLVLKSIEKKYILCKVQARSNVCIKRSNYLHDYYLKCQVYTFPRIDALDAFDKYI